VVNLVEVNFLFSTIEYTEKFWRDLLYFTKEKYLMGTACDNKRKRIDLGIINVRNILPKWELLR